jgi:hypothetical protein
MTDTSTKLSADFKLDAAPKIVEPTIYELSSPGRIGVDFPDPDVPRADLPDSLLRAELPLPELSEVDVGATLSNSPPSTTAWTADSTPSALVR